MTNAEVEIFFSAFFFPPTTTTVLSNPVLVFTSYYKRSRCRRPDDFLIRNNLAVVVASIWVTLYQVSMLVLTERCDTITRVYTIPGGYHLWPTNAGRRGGFVDYTFSLYTRGVQWRWKSRQTRVDKGWICYIVYLLLLLLHSMWCFFFFLKMWFPQYVYI